MKKQILTLSFASFSALAVVWGVFMSFDWVEEYFATKQSPQYESLPFEFKLKANPEDVIFSEAYTTGDGKDIVKYAYIAGEAGPQLNEDISRRTPESYTEVISQFKDEEGKPMETLKTTFIPKPQFYQKDGQWRQVEYATTTPEVFAMSGAIPHIKKRELVERILPGEPVFADTATFNPDPNTETNSVDGEFGLANWSSLYDIPAEACTESFYGAIGYSTGSIVFDSTAVMSIYVSSASEMSEGFWECITTVKRMFVLFNTATLADTASISAATFSIYVTGKINGGNDGYDTLNVVSSNPASNTALAITDFGSVGSTLYASAVDITSISTSAYLNISLNSTGRAAITTTGVSKFAVREGHELDGWDPGETSSIIEASTADVSGTSQDPKLEVTYTIPSSFSMGQWFPF